MAGKVLIFFGRCSPMPSQISLRRRGKGSDGIAGGFSPMPSQISLRRRGKASDGIAGGFPPIPSQLRSWRRGMHGGTNVAGPLIHAMDLFAVRNNNNLDSNNSEGRTALRTYKRNTLDSNISEDRTALRTYKRNILDSDVSEERTPMRTYKRRVRRVMPDELVWEILLRLPPKTLARFKSVCRAWLAIISSRPFITMHLRQSASRNEREPSFLIAPLIVCDMSDPKSMPETWHPDKVPFYHWQEAGEGNASLVKTMDLPGDAGSVYFPLHCDGLVLLPTATKLYVFNPSTGDVLNLPEGQYTQHVQAAGLGLDLGTNTYKVAHSFYRSIDYCNAGMEVFTIGGHGSCWRTLEDPPYPVMMPQNPAYFKGSLYWHIKREFLKTPLQGFLRLDLQEEKFDFISHPVVPSDGYALDFIELGGNLCLVQRLPGEVVFWTSSSSGDNQWHRVYVINNLPKAGCKALRVLDDCVFLQHGYCIYRHDKATGTTKEVASVDQLRYKNPRTGNLDFVGKDRYVIYIIPYTQSLVPLPRAR